MAEHERGSDRLGRHAKRFLTPLQKYEIWLQLGPGAAAAHPALIACSAGQSHTHSTQRYSAALERTGWTTHPT
jgi:hypothetical protein